MKNHDNSSSNSLYGNITEEDAKTIQSMVKVLDANGIPAEYYHVGGYSEEAVCMEKTDAGWIVYVGERGNRYQLTTHETVDWACICLMDQVAKSDEQYWRMEIEFDLALLQALDTIERNSANAAREGAALMKGIHDCLGSQSQRKHREGKSERKEQSRKIC